jgi:hypothetical protein
MASPRFGFPIYFTYLDHIAGCVQLAPPPHLKAAGSSSGPQSIRGICLARKQDNEKLRLWAPAAVGILDIWTPCTSSPSARCLLSGHIVCPALARRLLIAPAKPGGV